MLSFGQSSGPRLYGKRLVVTGAWTSPITSGCASVPWNNVWLHQTVTGHGWPGTTVSLLKYMQSLQWSETSEVFDIARNKQLVPCCSVHCPMLCQWSQPYLNSPRVKECRHPLHHHTHMGCLTMKSMEILKLRLFCRLFSQNSAIQPLCEFNHKLTQTTKLTVLKRLEVYRNHPLKPHKAH